LVQDPELVLDAIAVGGTKRFGFELPSVAGEPGAERRGLVRIVLAELIGEGAGEDRAVAAVRAFNGAAFDVGLAARAVPVLAERPGWAVLAEPDDREILALPERLGPAGGLVSAGRAGQRGRDKAETLALRAAPPLPCRPPLA
jgi:hypothetical protein